MRWVLSQQLVPRLVLAIGTLAFMVVLSIAGSGASKPKSELVTASRNAPPRSQVQKAAQPETSNWANLFGPTRDSRVRVANVPLDAWDTNGPSLLWTQSVGAGYSSPIVWNDHVVVLHRIGNNEQIDCRSATTGKLEWAYRYASNFDCSLAVVEHKWGIEAIRIHRQRDDQKDDWLQ